MTSHLEFELIQLKNAVQEMLLLGKNQIVKSKEAFLNRDTELAEEIIHNELRMNAMELSIERDCENTFALFNPVASDLRLVLAMLQINSEIERIGDHAEGIAKFSLTMSRTFDKKMLEELRFIEMYDTAISMIDDVEESMNTEDTKIARRVFKKDNVINEINKEAPNVISKYVKDDPEIIKHSLYLYSTIKKIERIGDLIKNIAEQIIFYNEAKVLKHKGKVPEKN